MCMYKIQIRLLLLLLLLLLIIRLLLCLLCILYIKCIVFEFPLVEDITAGRSLLLVASTILCLSLRCTAITWFK